MSDRRKYCATFMVVLAAIALNRSDTANAQSPKAAITPDQALDRIVDRENAMVKKLGEFHPFVETYIQMETKDQELGTVPVADRYFLSRLDVKGGLRGESLLTGSSMPFKFKPGPNVTYVADGFAAMILIDPKGFNRQSYTFQFDRREFLGAVRCLVFDIRPNK